MMKWIVCASVVAGLATVALADTGGSMGGGDWSSSSSSSGGGGGGGGWSSSSSSDYSYSSGGTSTSSGGGSIADMPAGAWVFLCVIVVFVWIGSLIAKSRSDDTSLGLGLDTYTPASLDSVDVSILRIAVDGRSRKFVQSELARIAKIADTKSADGRATMLREVAVLLRRLKDAWVYGGAVNEPMRAIGRPNAVFDKYVDD